MKEPIKCKIWASFYQFSNSFPGFSLSSRVSRSLIKAISIDYIKTTCYTPSFIFVTRLNGDMNNNLYELFNNNKIRGRGGRIIEKQRHKAAFYPLLPLEVA